MRPERQQNLRFPSRRLWRVKKRLETASAASKGTHRHVLLKMFASSSQRRIQAASTSSGIDWAAALQNDDRGQCRSTRNACGSHPCPARSLGNFKRKLQRPRLAEEVDSIHERQPCADSCLELCNGPRGGHFLWRLVLRWGAVEAKVLVQDHLGRTLGNEENLRHCQVGRRRWDHRAVCHAEVLYAMYFEVAVDDGIIVAAPHAASPAAVVDGTEHACNSSTVVDRARRAIEAGGTTNAPRPCHRFLGHCQVVRVGKCVVRNDRAHIRRCAGEGHGALRLCFAERHEECVSICLQGPGLPLEGVLQRRGLRLVEEGHEHDSHIRALLLRRRLCSSAGTETSGCFQHG
mmetsp:Transcript_48310/g.154286  ORF Transcript_48310/g.154286 Transcript_48310/m.154286 type:complete len:347 (+) Transcript_48310:108-1148(+)